MCMSTGFLTKIFCFRNYLIIRDYPEELFICINSLSSKHLTLLYALINIYQESWNYISQQCVVSQFKQNQITRCQLSQRNATYLIHHRIQICFMRSEERDILAILAILTIEMSTKCKKYSAIKNILCYLFKWKFLFIDRSYF